MKLALYRRVLRLLKRLFGLHGFIMVLVGLALLTTLIVAKHSVSSQSPSSPLPSPVSMAGEGVHSRGVYGHGVERAGPAKMGLGTSGSPLSTRPGRLKRAAANAASTPLPANRRLWDPTFLDSLRRAARGDAIQFELVEGHIASGTINCLQGKNARVVYVSGRLTQPEAGRFFFQRQCLPGVAGDFVGVVEFPASRKAYRLEPTGPGRASELVERPLESVICESLPRPQASPTGQSEAIPPLKPGDFPDVPMPPYQNGVPVLESLPDALPVVYLDFQGGYTPTWGGIRYERPNVTTNQIRDVWVRVAEDFMPFNLNITTDLRVFEKAPENSRQRVIITPTTTAAPDDGGISYIGSFNWTGDIPCWVFLVSGKACAEACSHEIGHTLGLGHKGLQQDGSDSEYFGGHGTGETAWAPIMGVGFYCNVSQWSRGEYSFADNADDELDIITTQNNSVSYRPDDTGDTLSTSRYLELYSHYTAGAEGVIERTGDTDAFQFTTSGGEISLRADPVETGPNLALQVALYDAHDVLLADNCPQDRLWASVSTNLPAGTYTFRVSGAGRGDPLTDGFSSYGSLGYYSVTGFVANARLPTRFAIPEGATNGTLVGAIPANHFTTNALSYSFVSGNEGNTFALDDSGSLFVADNRLLDYLTLGRSSQFPVQFELLVDIADTAKPSLSETNRRVVVAVLSTLGPPVILQQPRDVSAPASTNVSFTVSASHNQPLEYEWFFFSYQWFFNGAPILGATNSILSLNNIQAVNDGGYSVAAINSLGAVTSTVARLTVQPAAPVITVPPSSQAAFQGLGAGFSVAATGSEPFAYQWQLNGANIDGATNASLSISHVAPEDAGAYRVIVRNEVGSVTSGLETRLELAPVAAWGWNASGQTNLPLGLTNAVQIAAGAYHSVALRRDGSVVCWGADEQSRVPPELVKAVAIAAGGQHSLALRNDGTVVAWGHNTAGQTDVPGDLDHVVIIAAGGAHSLALRSDGTVRAWGSNSCGQTSLPTDLSNVVAIAAGAGHSLALRADGGLVAWGDTSASQSRIPAGLADVIAIAAGASHSLALRRNGTVVSWGDNNCGQTNVPRGLSNVVAIAAGSLHSLAVKDDGTMVAWGAGHLTELLEFPDFGQSIIPPSVTNVTAISGGGAHTLAFAGSDAPFITERPVNRSVYTGRTAVVRASATGEMPLSYQWQLYGTNLPGATNQVFVIDHAFGDSAGDYRVIVTNTLGVACSSEARLTLVDQPPFVVVQPRTFPGYITGQARLEVVADGSWPFFYQWQFNGMDIPGATNALLLLEHLTFGQSGDYAVVVSNAFGQVTSEKARLKVTQVVAWGAGTNRVSYPSVGQSMVPLGLDGVIQVVGGAYHSLALRNDGTVVAWGAGTNYTHNTPYGYGQSAVPAGLTNVVAIAAGAYHSLALKADGTVVAWGAGTNNSLSDPWSQGQSMVPSDLNNVVAISAGEYHSAAVRNDGRVVVWGSSRGYPSVTSVPLEATNVVAIASSSSGILAMRSDGTVINWGTGSLSVQMTSNAVAIAASQSYGLVLKNDGTIASLMMPPPRGLSNVVAIAAGSSHFLALKDDGTVVTWGATNNYGLGLIPTGLTNVADIGAGWYHSLAALGDGSPRFKVAPCDRFLRAGAKTTLTAMAVGAPPLCYQWQFNGNDLPDATNNWLRITNLQAPYVGEYRVIVSNALGAVTSPVANVGVALPLGQVLNAPSLSWSTSGNLPWRGQIGITHDGVDAAQSGSIGDGQCSVIQTTVTGPGTLSFWWKVSSEAWFDYLSFAMDGQKQMPISGEVDWELRVLPVTAGTHLLKWTYAKDSGVSAGLDTAWLDEVTFVPDSPLITAQPLGQTKLMGDSIRLTVGASGAPPLSYQWIKDGINLAGTASASLTIRKATRHDSGVYAVAVSNGGGSTLSSNAVVAVRVPQKLATPVWQPDEAFALVSGDADGRDLLPEDLEGLDAEASTDLLTWTLLTNSLTLTNGALLLVDPQATNFPHRFYRVFER